MTWPKGQSGQQGLQGKQPGQPKKDPEQTFTQALRKAICDKTFTITLEDGNTKTGIPKDVMADYMGEVMLTGSITLKSGLIMDFSPKEFMEAYWKIALTLDGPPVQMVDQTNRNILQFDAQDTIFDKAKVEKTNEVE